jgi:hypothetical protein
MTIPFIWDMAPRHWVIGYRRFEGKYFLHLPGSIFLKKGIVNYTAAKTSKLADDGMFKEQ